MKVSNLDFTFDEYYENCSIKCWAESVSTGCWIKSTAAVYRKRSSTVCLNSSKGCACWRLQNERMMIVQSTFYRASYASAVLLVVILPVCLSVRHTRALWLFQIQRTDRRYFYTARKGSHSSFLMPKISAKFKRGHPQRGRQREVG